MAKDKCDRNCATCGADNRSFCAVQMAMANQEILMSLLQEVRGMKSGSVDLLSPQFTPSPKEIAEPTGSGAATIND